MQRRAIKLLLFLLAGAIINVAVASWIAMFGTEVSLTSMPGGSPVDIPQWALRRATEENEQFEEGTGVGFSSNGVSTLYVSARDDTLRKLHEQWQKEHGLRVKFKSRPNAKFLSTGFPVRSLRGEAWAHTANWAALHPGVPPTKLVEMFQPLPATGVALPLRPLFPGFAVNTIFYAAIAWGGWMLFAVPGAVRRRLRHKRGQCASCGYSLRGRDITSEKCPECGAIA